MATEIPFIPDEDTRPGTLYRPRPGLRRVVAPNGGPFTYTGTGTYILGEGEVAMIDPGPDLAPHIDMLLEAIAGETLSHIFVTHTHRDHSPAAREIRTVTGAEIVGCAPLLPAKDGDGGLEEALDDLYAPDRVLADGEEVAGDGWTLRALATPGHVSNHLCFEWAQENALFSGDHIMGWSTSVVVPPHGDMRDYVASLEKVRARNFNTLWPTHGQPVEDPGPFIDALIAHRRDREAEILEAVARGLSHIPEIVAAIYTEIPQALFPAAGQSVLAHLIDLERRGIVAADPAPTTLAKYRKA